MILTLYDRREGVETSAGNRAVYDVSAGEARFGAARVVARALVWELAGATDPDAMLAAEVTLDRGREWLLRCDRVDFPPGGVAYRHTHPGPGIRCLLRGSITIDSGGRRSTYAPFEPWFESGAEPVLATTSPTEESSFVRAMLLPAEWAGKRTIRYVDPADEAKPKLQRATVFFDEPIVL